MPKIHILGGPGSGKTTLARALVTQFAIPHYDLDVLGQRNGTDDSAWMADIDRIVAQPGWVCEGIYLVLTERLLAAAEHIVVLEVPWRVAAWRIVRRHVITSFRRTNRYGGVPGLFQFLRNTRNYYRNHSPTTAAAEQHYLASRPTSIQPLTTAQNLHDLATYPMLICPPTADFVRKALARYGSNVVVLRTAADQQQFFHRLRQAFS